MLNSTQLNTQCVISERSPKFFLCTSSSLQAPDFWSPSYLWTFSFLCSTQRVCQVSPGFSVSVTAGNNLKSLSRRSCRTHFLFFSSHRDNCPIILISAVFMLFCIDFCFGFFSKRIKRVPVIPSLPVVEVCSLNFNNSR